MSASADISVKQIDDFAVDLGLDMIGVSVKSLPLIKIDGLDVDLDLAAKVEPITINKLTADVGITRIPKINIGLDPITVNPLRIRLDPIDFNLAIKEIPSVRVHLPLHFGFGFSLLGHELFSARVAGEAQVITEPYEPNPCEHCEPPKGKKP